ncbi:HAD family hydrolase [bacterium]|jgi:phosphoglycolate phosphatase-like HAD superfamily hydrolase|nr:HAD family hydrolase [bacterium]
MQSISTLVFDFDGTICDSMDAAVLTLNRYSEYFRYKKITPEMVPTLRTKTTQDILVELGISRFYLPVLAPLLQRAFYQRVSGLRPFKGMREVFKELSTRGYRLGVLTSNAKKNVLKFNEVNHLHDFEFIYSGISLFDKATSLELLLRKHKLSEEEVVYIGDETRDIEAAHTAGLSVISVGWGFHSPDLLKQYHPEFLIHDPRDLIEVLSKKNTCCE